RILVSSNFSRKKAATRAHRRIKIGAQSPETIKILTSSNLLRLQTRHPTTYQRSRLMPTERSPNRGTITDTVVMDMAVTDRVAMGTVRTETEKSFKYRRRISRKMRPTGEQLPRLNRQTTEQRLLRRPPLPEATGAIRHSPLLNRQIPEQQLPRQ